MALRFLRWRFAAARDHGNLYRCNISETLYTISEDELSAELLEREKAIFIEQAKESGKPDDIIEKMIVGRMKKFVNEVTLYGQSFVKDPDMTVGALVKSKSSEVESFVRYEVGEGIEKKEDNFVEEVMAQAQGG